MYVRVPFDYPLYKRTIDAFMGCYDHDLVVRNKPMRDQRPRLLRQCSRCGLIDSRPVRFADAGMPACDVPLWDGDREAVFKEARQLAHQFVSKKTMADRHHAYLLYLCSPDWAAKRTAVLARKHGLCEYEGGCGNRATQVHHRTYDRIGAEKLEDLLAVCSTCHRTIHGIT